MIEHSIFEHPLNGHRETVSRLSHLWMLLSGILYLMMKGLWPHVAVWTMIALFTMAAPILGIMATLLAWIVSPSSHRGGADRYVGSLADAVEAIRAEPVAAAA